MLSFLSFLWNLFLAAVISIVGWFWFDDALGRVIATAFGLSYMAFATFYDALRRARRKACYERRQAQHRMEVAQRLAAMSSNGPAGQGKLSQ